MEKLLKLLESKDMRKEIQSLFSVTNGVLEIDIDELEKLVESHEEFRKLLLSVNLNGDYVKTFKNEFLNMHNNNAEIWHSGILDNIRAFDLDTAAKNVLFGNYFDAIINQYKIHVNVYVLVNEYNQEIYIGESDDLYHGFKVTDVNVLDGSNFTTTIMKLLEVQINKDLIIPTLETSIYVYCNDTDTLLSPFVFNMVMVNLSTGADEYIEQPFELKGLTLDEFKNHYLPGIKERDPSASYRLLEELEKCVDSHFNKL